MGMIGEIRSKPIRNEQRIDHEGIVFVTDRGLSGAKPLTDVVLAPGRGLCVQLRKRRCRPVFLSRKPGIKALVAPYCVPLIIDDRLDIALAVGADGVHVGQTDMPYGKSPGKLIGRKSDDRPFR